MTFVSTVQVMHVEQPRDLPTSSTLLRRGPTYCAVETVDGDERHR